MWFWVPTPEPLNSTDSVNNNERQPSRDMVWHSNSNNRIEVVACRPRFQQTIVSGSVTARQCIHPALSHIPGGSGTNGVSQYAGRPGSCLTESDASDILSQVQDAKPTQSSRILTRPRFRLRNAKYHPSANRSLLARSTTWDKSPLHGDSWAKQAVFAAETSAWKCSTLVETMSEADTQQISEACSSQSECDQEVELDQDIPVGCTQTSFDGIWSKAVIHNGVLTWFEEDWDAPCKPVDIELISATNFRISCEAQESFAELEDDGTLHWDTGDIWVRCKIQFEGKWKRATISGTTLRWNEGEDVAISILSTTSFRMVYVNKLFTAQLIGDGKLYWDDGDVWCPVVVADKKLLFTNELPPWLRSRRRTGQKSESAACKIKPNVTMPSCDSAIGIQTHLTIKPCDSGKYTGHREWASPSSPCKSAVVSSDVRVLDSPTVPADVSNPDSATLASGLVQACAVSQGSAKVTVSLTPIGGRVYKGVVTWFRGSYGWISCEAIAAEYPGCDVMVHKNDCNFRPRQDDLVQFRLALNGSGHPQAFDVAKHCEKVINARDWFSASTAERKEMRSTSK